MNYVAKKLQPGQPYPTLLHPGIVYVERDRHTEEPTRIAFLCPCGCTTKFDVPLDTGHWKLEIAGHENRPLPTLTPNVVHHAGCLSNFAITGGEVLWAGLAKAKSAPKPKKAKATR